MTEVTASPITMKCKVCGGDIVNDYLTGKCVCAHCGNKWAIQDMIPGFSKYSHIIENITRANNILENGNNNKATVNEAKIAFMSAISECSRYNDAVTSELVTICKNGRSRADMMLVYIKGKDYYDKKSYRSAVKEFSKIPGYKDSDELIGQCKAGIERNRKKMIPVDILFSFILPLILCIILKEKAGLPMGAVIPIFFVCSAGLGYVLYRGGVPSVIIMVISVLCAVPLIIYLFLAYVFHINVVTAAIIAIVAPIAVIVVLVVLGIRSDKD